MSPSESASPSTGYSDYTKGDYVILPTNDDDLETAYTEQQEIDVATSDDTRVTQTGTSQYMVHQFKSFVGQRTYAEIKAEFQSTLAGTSSTIYFQVYNRTTSSWTTIDTDSFISENKDMAFVYSLSDLTNYKDSRNVISVRVYQLADTTQRTLSVDLYEVCFPLVYTSKYSNQSTSYTSKYSSQNNTYVDKYGRVCVSDN